jgi:hypothetical protein
VNACVHTYTKPQTSSTRSRGLGRRIHGSVEDTKLSTNKQHSLSDHLCLDPLMVGIRSPDGLVVGSCTRATLEFWVRFPTGSKREEPGKTGRHPVLKYRVPHGSQPRVHSCVVVSLVHTILGSLYLIAHVVHYPPPPTRIALY